MIADYIRKFEAKPCTCSPGIKCPRCVMLEKARALVQSGKRGITVPTTLHKPSEKERWMGKCVRGVETQRRNVLRGDYKMTDAEKTGYIRACDDLLALFRLESYSTD